jgi:serine/threonine-protein kinase
MTDPARFSQVDVLFAAVLDIPAADRRAFLDEGCGSDRDLRQQVERLLAADASAGAFLAQPAVVPLDLTDGAAQAITPPSRLGPYRLLREIGSGGMGTVYLARRDDAEYEREVAVKILRTGIGEPEAVHRFLAERQILARLEHPGIARLYDGGSTADGRPFLVMELVDGLPLDQYCDQHGLGIDARLALFGRVCAAVQHAHQNLLVHRDLKAANILVTADGEPKLLDFGIAKQLLPGAAPDLTRTGSRVLTPSCASPEQVRGEPISTASDVYSLGVLLYELVAGRSPYRVASDLPHEIERAICEQQPEPPSQALSRRGPGEPSPEAASRARGSRPAALRRRLRGDLDTIVQTALRKDPARRYGSAAELAADLDNHLQHLPVAARPDSLLYRTHKLLRRRRTPVAVAAAAALVAIAFVFGLVEQGRRLAQERDKARYALSFLVDTFRGADPYHTRGARLTAEEILAQGAARVSKELAGQPDVQAAVLDAIGQVRLGLGRADGAEPLLARALELRRQSPGTARLDLAASLEHLAEARYEQSKFAPAEALLREAVALRRREGSAPLALAAALNQLGMTIRAREPSEEVAALQREALGLARGAEGAAGPTLAATLFEMGLFARDKGDYERAERLYRQGLAIEAKLLAPHDPKALRDQAELGVLLLDSGKPKEAEALLRQNLALQRRFLGSGHPHLLSVLSNIGMARQAQGDYVGAEAAYRDALALPRSASGDLDLTRALVLGNLASTLQDQQLTEQSVPLFTEALALRRRILGDRHPLVAQVLLQLARAERMRGRYAEGLELARQSLAIVEGAEGPDHPHVAAIVREMGRNLMAQQDAAAAEPYLRRALDLRRSLPRDHPDVASAQISLALCLFALRRDAEAEGLLHQGRATLVASFGADDPRVQDADQQLADLLKRRQPRG